MRALAVRSIGIRGVGFFGELRRRARATHRIAAPGDERIGQHAHELIHRIEGGLLRSRRHFAGDLRQARRRQPAEHQRNAAVGIEETDDRVGGTLLIGVEAAARRRDEVQREIQIRIVAVVTQTGFEIRRQIGVGERIERAADAAGGIEDGVLLGDIRPRRERRLHGRATERRRAGDIGAVGIRRRDFDHVARRRREHEIALHRQRPDRIARRQRAAIDGGVADGAVAAERCAGVDGGQRRGCDRAIHAERAGVDVGGAGVGVEAGQRKHAAAVLLHAAGVRDDAAVCDCIGTVEIQRAAVEDVADDRAGGAAIADIHGADEARGVCARDRTEIVDRYRAARGSCYDACPTGTNRCSARYVDGHVSRCGSCRDASRISSRAGENVTRDANRNIAGARRGRCNTCFGELSDGGRNGSIMTNGNILRIVLVSNSGRNSRLDGGDHSLIRNRDASQRPRADHRNSVENGEDVTALRNGYRAARGTL